MSFGENLQLIRAKHNITQEQLAEQLEVTRQSVSKWESGTSYPEMNTILKICEMYQVSMDELMRGTLEERDEAEQQRYEKHMMGFARKISSAVGTIIAATGVVAVMDELKVADNICGMVFFTFLVLSVVVMIVAGMEHDTFTKKYPSISQYHTEEEIEKFDKKFVWMIAGPVATILIGIIMMMAFDETRYENFAGAGFLVLVAIAVTVMTYGGICREVYHVEEYNKSNRPKKEDKVVGVGCGVIMLLATIVFLLWGFLGTNPEAIQYERWGSRWVGMESGWNISWIAFPIGGILCGIFCLIMSVIRKDQNNEE